MRPSDPRRREWLAQEYVLGTLQGAARHRFERWLLTDRALQADVRRWQQRLVLLNLWLLPRNPRRQLLRRFLGWLYRL